MTREPNTAPDAERTCLSMALLCPETQDELLGLLRPQDFSILAHRAAWTGLQAIRSEGRAADLVSVAQWARSHGSPETHVTSAELAELCQVTPAVANVREHAQAVAALGRVREMLGALRTLMTDGKSDITNPGAWVESVAAQVTELAAGVASSQDEPETLAVAAERAVQAIRYQAEHPDEQLGIQTGIRGWDDHVMGLLPGKVYVVAGRPGSGKTVFATQAALGCARNPTAPGVAVFTLEMSTEELALRMLSQTSLVSHKPLQRKTLSTPEWAKVTAAQNLFDKLPIVLDARMDLGAFNLRSRASRIASQLHKRGNKLGVVVIDYLQLMKGDKRAGNREQEVAQLSRACKVLAKELEVAVLLLSQLSRPLKGKENEAPKLSDLRESGAIEQDADVVTFTHAPTDDTRELIIAKGRHCGTAKIQVSWDGARVRFGGGFDQSEGFEER